MLPAGLVDGCAIVAANPVDVVRPTVSINRSSERGQRVAVSSRFDAMPSEGLVDGNEVFQVFFIGV
jgi:hypothetical protein